MRDLTSAASAVPPWTLAVGAMVSVQLGSALSVPMIDTVGAKEARLEISAIKVIAPQVACTVIDRAIEVFGGAGVSDDTPLAYFYAWARALRIVSV